VTVLTLAGVSRWYGNVVAVNDVTFEVGPGITGLLGPNGAGKTTLLHMMAGFLAPSAGDVRLDETPTWRHPQVYRRIGFVPEREAVYSFLTARQFVLASARLAGVADPRAAADRAIDMVELRDAATPPTGPSVAIRRACGNARRWRRPWCTTRPCSSSTSRSTAWIRGSGSR
jgi:ABC-2 type transport system ATP-binding protein